MSEIRTYPEMNAKICGILEIGDDPMQAYAAQRIRELQDENELLLEICHEAAGSMQGDIPEIEHEEPAGRFWSLYERAGFNPQDIPNR